MSDCLISCGPWLTNPDPGGITVGFTTTRPCAAYLEFKKTAEAAWQRVFQSRGGQIVRRETCHVFHLNGLLPGTRYDYRVGAFDTENGEEENRSASFTVFDPLRKQYSFMALADLQFSPSRRRSLIRKYHELCEASKCDFIVTLGDMCGEINCFEQDILEDHVGLLCELGASHRPVIFLRGNHEPVLRNTIRNQLQSIPSWPGGLSRFGFLV
jgi:hypothetical protein